MEQKTKILIGMGILAIVAMVIVALILISGCVYDREPQILNVTMYSNDTISNTFYENDSIYICAYIISSMNGGDLNVEIRDLQNISIYNVSAGWAETDGNGRDYCINLSNILKPDEYKAKVKLTDNVLKEREISFKILGPSEQNLSQNLEKLCNSDSDCACGIHIKTGNCFYGNKNFVDTSEQCPDFCTGIGGNLKIKCVKGECMQNDKIRADQINETSSAHKKLENDVVAVVNANNKFAFELYNKFSKDSKEESNIFFSPYSISTALAMTYEGAGGKTAEEMQSVLHFPENDVMRKAGFLAIISQINEKDKKYELSTANALWAQKDYKFLKEYFKIVEQYYSGKVTNLDFVRDTENSRATINRWVENRTNNKIKDLIPQGVLNDMTRLVLTNAIYFKGKWVKQFDEKNTVEDDFRVSSEKTVKALMMSLTGEEARFNYTETEDLQILELPYEGNDLSMIVLLPKKDNLNLIEESISPEKINEWKNNLREKHVDVYLPKFKFETKYFMKETLGEMGMPTAFSMDADFSGMDGTKNLFISSVIHQAFVEVNEEGTEAAAATGVVVGRTSMPHTESIIFRADHPFIFIIQQKENANILFLGRVNNPSK